MSRFEAYHIGTICDKGWYCQTALCLNEGHAEVGVIWDYVGGHLGLMGHY